MRYAADRPLGLAPATVLDPDDARRAVDAGVDGIVVSNHGGRQLDAVPSTARVLPEIVDAVGDRVEVLADGACAPGSTW